MCNPEISKHEKLSDESEICPRCENYVEFSENISEVN